MRPNEDNRPAGHDPRRSRRFELFYFERVGSRSYLRFTNLALFLILFLTLGAIAMMLALFLWNRSQRTEETDVNIRPAAQEPANYNSPLIQPAPMPPPLPKVIQGPMPSAPNPLATPTPAGNSNRMPTRSPSPSPTPSPSPVRTPT